MGIERYVNEKVSKSVGHCLHNAKREACCLRMQHEVLSRACLAEPRHFSERFVYKHKGEPMSLYAGYLQLQDPLIVLFVQE